LCWPLYQCATANTPRLRLVMAKLQSGAEPDRSDVCAGIGEQNAYLTSTERNRTDVG
jgi:hypothetical protein